MKESFADALRKDHDGSGPVIVADGAIDPEHVVTPGIFVQRVVAVAEPALESELIARGATYA